MAIFFCICPSGKPGINRPKTGRWRAKTITKRRTRLQPRPELRNAEAGAPGARQNRDRRRERPLHAASFNQSWFIARAGRVNSRIRAKFLVDREVGWPEYLYYR